jgi:hypothetical protein
VAYQHDGIVAFVTPGTVSRLAEGDLIMAVEGVPIAEWAERLFQPGADRLSWAPGQIVRYSILRQGRPLELTVTLVRLPFWSVMSERWGLAFFVLVSQLLTTLVVVRRPYVTAARVLFVWAMLGSQMYVWSVPVHVGDIVSGFGFWLGRGILYLMGVLFYPALVHFALVFPRPLPAVRRHPALVAGVYLGAVLLFVAILLGLRRESTTSVAWLGDPIRALYIVGVVCLTAAMAIIVVQMRRHRTGRERQQVTWVALGGVIAGTIGLGLGVIAPLMFGYTPLDINLYGLLLTIFPISITVAIWRYQLFDVDLIVRRTLVYSLLTALITLVYFGGVTTLQQLVMEYTGRRSQLVLVVMTLLIAWLVSPARQGLQRIVDRAFYREPYDAQAALAHFVRRTQSETDPERLAAALADTVQMTVQPDRVRVWLPRLVDAPHSREGRLRE